MHSVSFNTKQQLPCNPPPNGSGSRRTCQHSLRPRYQTNKIIPQCKRSRVVAQREASELPRKAFAVGRGVRHREAHMKGRKRAAAHSFGSSACRVSQKFATRLQCQQNQDRPHPVALSGMGIEGRRAYNKSARPWPPARGFLLKFVVPTGKRACQERACFPDQSAWSRQASWFAS